MNHEVWHFVKRLAQTRRTTNYSSAQRVRAHGKSLFSFGFSTLDLTTPKTIAKKEHVPPLRSLKMFLVQFVRGILPSKHPGKSGMFHDVAGVFKSFFSPSMDIFEMTMIGNQPPACTTALIMGMLVSRSVFQCFRLFCLSVHLIFNKNQQNNCWKRWVFATFHHNHVQHIKMTGNLSPNWFFHPSLTTLSNSQPPDEPWCVFFHVTKTPCQLKSRTSNWSQRASTVPQPKKDRPDWSQSKPQRYNMRYSSLLFISYWSTMFQWFQRCSYCCCWNPCIWCLMIWLVRLKAKSFCRCMVVTPLTNITYLVDVRIACFVWWSSSSVFFFVKFEAKSNKAFSTRWSFTLSRADLSWTRWAAQLYALFCQTKCFEVCFSLS